MARGVPRRVADRRRITVEPVTERAAPVARSYDAVDLAAASALDGLDDATLAGIHAYLAASVEALREASKPQGSTADAPEDGSTADVGAPVASATLGRLVFVTGAPAVTIPATTALGGQLYRARFRGAIPSARVRDGVVTIRYPRFAWFDWRTRIGDQWLNASAHWKRDTTELQLNARLGWSIELRGGATSLKADLAPVRLTDFDLLGEPVGIVPVRVRGGAGDVSVVRPTGVATRLTVIGGAPAATLDGEEAWSTGPIATRGFDDATDGFEIMMAGGVNTVVVSAR